MDTRPHYVINIADSRELMTHYVERHFPVTELETNVELLIEGVLDTLLTGTSAQFGGKPATKVLEDLGVSTQTARYLVETVHDNLLRQLQVVGVNPEDQMLTHQYFPELHSIVVVPVLGWKADESPIDVIKQSFQQSMDNGDFIPEKIRALVNSL